MSGVFEFLAPPPYTINRKTTSSSGVNLENFLIPLEEINRATQNFSSENEIDDCEGNFYRGQLSERWQNREAAIKRYCIENDVGKEVFLHEVELLSSFHHENIIHFIGYCEEDDEFLIVTEYAINGSLFYQLDDEDKRCSLTWAKRLKICLGVAKALEYLQSGLGERGRVIHRDFDSEHIWLDENMEAKDCDFELAILIPRNLPHVYTHSMSVNDYTDPLHRESGIVNAKTDTYAFGVILFEMLTGKLANGRWPSRSSLRNGKSENLMDEVRHYYDVGLERLLDPVISDKIDGISFHMVQEIAYKCISLKMSDRPTFDVITKTIDRAIDIHNRASNFGVRSLQHQHPTSFEIPLEEIKQATKDFSLETEIKFKVYRGQLSEHWQSRSVAIKCHSYDNEIELLSSFRHENIVPFIGYCNHKSIIVTEYAINGSLDYHLKDPKKRSLLTWPQRLKICLGVARGLKYLHSGLGERFKVIQRTLNCKNILLDENMEAKLCGFGHSVLIPRDQPHVYARDVDEFHKDPIFGLDPVYQQSGFLNTESNVYVFGVVMFQLLSGRLTDEGRNLNDINLQGPPHLMSLVRCYYGDEPNKLVDPLIRNQLDSQSLHKFTDLAYECISFDIRERPPMNRVVKRIEELMDFQSQNRTTTTIQSRQNQNLENFLIPMEEIKTAIGGDFSLTTKAGDGGFGVVYKGQLSERWEKRMVAIKRLDPTKYDGNKEFLHELNLIFRFQHDNIIPFVGYCDQGNEMIIVTEYAINGSLDCYLEDKEKRGRLTWTHRLKICLGAARGLNHLHFGLGKGNRVIHRDIKSANILLNDNLEAKICDFGLSKLELGNQTHTGVYTKQAGTYFYMDPIYQESGKLRTQSDVYSFGVMMFEILSGMMAYNYKSFGDGEPQHLISLVRRYYAAGGLDMLMDSLIRDQPYDPRSFHTFHSTAYKCINMNYKKRPTMEFVIERIEEALAYQASLPAI